MVIDLPGLALIRFGARIALQFPPEKGSDSVRFLGDFSFGEVDDPVAGCFEGQVGSAFVGISVWAARAIDLNSKALLLPEEVDQHSSCPFS